MRHFTDADVERALDGADLETPLANAFVELAAGRAAQQPRMRTDAGDVKLSTLGAVIPAMDAVGAKVYTTLRGEFRFVIVLFSAATGEPLATFDAAAVTRRRTAAVSLLAARAAALPEVDAIAVFGTGVQGRAHLEAFARAYPKAALRWVGRTHPAAAAAEATRALGRTVQAMEPREALHGAQVVVTATRSPAPLFDGGWVEAGAVVCAVGSSRPDTRELDDALMARASCVIVEWREQALREAGDFQLLAPAVRERLEVVDLGEVLCKPGGVRRGAHDIVVFKSVGVGIEGIAIAALAYRRLGLQR